MRPMRPILPACLLVLAACGHTEPFDYAPEERGPFEDGVPTRLTYDRGFDGPASWGPDGMVVYAYADPASRDKDTCLGVLPATGGARVRDVCEDPRATAQQTDVHDWPALSPSGDLAYFHGVRIGSYEAGFNAAQLSWRRADSPKEERLLATMPFPTVPGGPVVISAVRDLAWLPDGTVIFVGASEDLVQPCPVCDAVIVEHGRGVWRVDPATQLKVLVPGTEEAISATATEGAILFARRGDARVWRFDLASGTAAPFLEPGGPGEAPVRLAAGGPLLAVGLGPAEHVSDRVVLVDLRSGAVRDLLPADGVPYFRVLPDPSGERLLLETGAGDLYVTGAGG
jgi:hypothetical protein